MTDVQTETRPDSAATQLLGSHPLPRVNLLPPEIAEAATLRRLQAALAGGVLAAAGLVVALTLAASASADAARDDLAATQAEQNRLSGEIAQLEPVRATSLQVDAAEARLSQASVNEIEWSQYLSDLSVTLPGNVWLEQMSVAPPAAVAAAQPPPDPATAAAQPAPDPATADYGTVTFTGRGSSHADVAEWLEMLEAQPGYRDPYLSTSTVDDALASETVVFTSTVTVGPEALANSNGQQP
jgi:Tfp pilus assembly protein PilN